VSTSRIPGDNRAPCLSVSDLRVDVGGVPAIDGLTLASTGDHVLLLGAARALYQAAAIARPIARGEVRVEGLSPRDAMRAKVAAYAPLDPAMPGSWTVSQYVVWSARLAGHPRGTAASLAGEALERMQLTSVGKAKLASAPLSQRRAVAVAAAIATGAGTVFMEDPVAGLPDEAGRPLARAAARATSDRRTVVFAARVALESPIALAADEAIVVDEAHVVAQGAPAEIAAAERTFALRVHGDVDAFVRAVAESGGQAVSWVGGPIAHVRVELGPMAPRDLVRIAAKTNAVVMELRPLAACFA
jgi:ABC-type multidrug transport system ATPase subunit